MMCLVFVGFYNCFYNCYAVLMFALLVANWPFCINKFDLIWFDVKFKFYISVFFTFVNAVIASVILTAEAHISTTWRRGLLALIVTYLRCITLWILWASELNCSAVSAFAIYFLPNVQFVSPSKNFVKEIQRIPRRSIAATDCCIFHNLFLSAFQRPQFLHF